MRARVEEQVAIVAVVQVVPVVASTAWRNGAPR